MNKIMFMFITGLITTLFGVGGVENSFTDTELLQSLAVSFTGLGIMWVSTLMMRVENSRG